MDQPQGKRPIRMLTLGSMLRSVVNASGMTMSVKLQIRAGTLSEKHAPSHILVLFRAGVRYEGHGRKRAVLGWMVRVIALPSNLE